VTDPAARDPTRVIGGLVDEGEWTWLSRARHAHGLPAALADFVREAKRSSSGPGSFERASAALAKHDPYHAAKRGDLVRLLERYDEACGAIGLRDPEDEIRTFASELRSGKAPLSLDFVVFDGFFGFTGTQQLFVEAVAGRSKGAIVTLTLDPRTSRERAFAYPLRTRDRLLKAGFVETRIQAPGRRFISSGLVRLEEALFEDGAVAELPVDVSGVRFFEAASPRGEIEMIAREIRRLSREEGYHWSDFMIVLRDVAPHRDLVESVLSESGLPCEVHERKRLADHPLGLMLAAWMRVFGSEASLADWIRFFRSGYLGIDPRAAQEAETVLSALSAADGVCDVLARLASPAVSPELVCAFEPVLAAHRAASEALSPVGFRRAIEDFTVACSLRASKGACEADIGEEIILTETIREVLDGVVFHAARSGRFSPTEMADHFGTRLETALYSPEASGKNRIQVYDVSLATQKEYRVVFVAGLEDGRFPRPAPTDPVLSEDERAGLAAEGFDIDGASMRASGEKFYFYMAATRAKEKLYLTRAAAGADGRELPASIFLRSVRRAFAPVAVPILRGRVSPVPLLGEAETLRDFAKIFSSDSACAAEAAQTLCASATARSLASLGAAFGALKGETHLRSEEARNDLCESSAPLSATQLAKLTNCGYQHFAYQSLKLRDHGVETASQQDGKIAHEALKEAYTKLYATPRTRPPVENELKAAVAEALAAVFEKHPVAGEKPYRSALRRLGLERRLRRFAAAEAERLASSPAYRPSKFEWDFYFTLELGGRPVAFRGKIDRIDIDPEKGRALVLDYKSSLHGLGHVNLLRGEDAQTSLYLWAVENALKLTPVGIEFVALDETAKIARFARNLPGEADGKAKSGWHDATEFAEALERMKSGITSKVEKLRASDISADSISRAYCDYHALCRFEGWRHKKK